MRLENEWTAIDVGKTYTVSSGSFIAGGKDGYITFGTIPADKKTDLGVIDAPTFVLYAQQVGTLVDPPKDEFSTTKFTAAGNSDFGTCASATTEAPTATPTRAPTKKPIASTSTKKPVQAKATKKPESKATKKPESKATKKPDGAKTEKILFN